MDPEELQDNRAFGVCNLTPGSTVVNDADEEVFLLYSDLAGKSSKLPTETGKFRGLGHLDSRKDIITIEFELSKQPSTSSAPIHDSSSRKGQRRKGSTSTHEKRKLQKGANAALDRVVEVKLAQDVTALRSRTGDTGSVVWQASIDFARIVLEQHHNQVKNPLFNFNLLRESHVLELGSGTGLLGVLLSQLTKQYTVTDIDDLVPLIKKNLSLNIPNLDATPKRTASASTPSCKVTAESLDWVELLNCPPALRRSSFSYDLIDLLLIVDCIYHPSLLPSLIHAIDYLSTPEHTTVLVVVELRAEDVIRQFLELWLEAGSKGTWEVWRVQDVLQGPYAVWIGRKQGHPSDQ